MHIIEVIPITALPPQVPQLLSYYYNKPLLKGAVVEVLIGNRKVLAAVTSSVSVEEQKASLKKSDFQLKKISGVISESPLVSDIQFKLALWLSKNYFAPLGLSLKTVLPSFFLKKNMDFKSRIDEPEIRAGQDTVKPEILLSRGKDIIRNIDSRIKKTLKAKKQVLLIVPEISTAKYLYDYFAGYYETAIIHSKVTPKQLYLSWNKINSGEAEIIIGTRQALFAPFSGLGLIIVEDWASDIYKSDMSPKYHARDLALRVAGIYSSEIMLIGQIPDISSYVLVKNGAYSLNDKREGSRAEIKLENMLEEIKSGNFSIFSRNLKSNLEKGLKENKKILLFSTRKGFSGYLICENCGFHFNCPNCSIPFKVYKSPEKLLVCHRCSASGKIPESCPNCHSSKLKSAGFAGSEKIKDEVERILNYNGLKRDIVLLDADSNSSSVENSKSIEDGDASIYIATQSIFNRRFNLGFDLIGIPSLDSLTSIPDFRAEENLFLQFEKLLDFGPKTIIAQSYDPDTKILEMLKAGDYRGFYERELPARNLFGYPPFARLIKLSFRSPDRNKAGYEARILSEKLKMAIIQRKLGDKIKLAGPSPAFVEKEKNLYINNIVIKIAIEHRPDEILRFVPSNWMIDVDPKSIL